MNLNSIPFTERVVIKAKRRQVVKDNHLKGRSLNEISDIIGMSRKTVCRIVRDLRRDGELPPMTEAIYIQRVSRHHRALAALRAGNVKKYAALYNRKTVKGVRPSKVSIGRDMGFGGTSSYRLYKDAERDGLIEPMPRVETYTSPADPEIGVAPPNDAGEETITPPDTGPDSGTGPELSGIPENDENTSAAPPLQDRDEENKTGIPQINEDWKGQTIIPEGRVPPLQDGEIQTESDGDGTDDGS